MTTGQPDPPEPPDHEKQAWDAIVADLRGQIDLGAGRGDAAPDLVPVEDLDEDFVPPHPPPIPAPPDAVGRFSWAAALGGPALVIVATALGWDRWLANLGVALAIGGFASLVWRMKDRDGDDGDDGAVV